MPDPQPGEARADFINRCMADVESVNDFPRADQRFAVCTDEWERSQSVNQLLLQAATLTAGMVEKKSFMGREWLVAPIVLVREMVLEGGELLPADEIASSTALWEGRPVTVFHPQKNGAFSSAGSLAVAEKSEIGRIYNTRFDQGKLKGELWIDLERAKVVDQGEEIVRILESGELLEVSTGYFASIELTGGAFEGTAYHAIQRDLGPDHLALLPGGLGKCSVSDGCGAPRINRETSMDKEQAKELEQTMGKRIVEGIRSAFSLTSDEKLEKQETVTINVNVEGLSMERNALIERLASCNACQFEKAELEAMTDERLNWLEGLNLGGSEEGSQEGTESKEGKESEGQEGKEGKELEGKENEGKEETPVDLDASLVAALNELGTDGLKAILTEHRDNAAAVEEERLQVIGRLVANEACPLTKDQLVQYDLEALGGLEKVFAPKGTFELAAGGRTYEENAKHSEYWSDGLIIHSGPKPEAKA